MVHLEVAKRNARNTLEKMCNPLGDISPHILDGDLCIKWKMWLNDMKKVNKIVIRRCHIC